MAKKVLKTKIVKKPVKAKTKAKAKAKVQAKPAKKAKVVAKKKVVKVVKTEAKAEPQKCCDVCKAKAPLAPVFSYDICLDCYLLLEPYFNNIVQEMKDDSN